MAEYSSHAIRRLVAELRSELSYIERTVVETLSLPAVVAHERVTLYAAAALLDTFYTGVEKAFRRIAAELGGIPEGSGWHRTLLDDMSLEIPKVRPAVLAPATARALGQFLAFRHRFRDLYLFDLEPAPLNALVRDLAPTWATARAEIEEFARVRESLADQLD